MRTIAKSFVIAFAMYSKIPMPFLKWEEKDMQYAMCFFPWIGAVIGAFVFAWMWVCRYVNPPQLLWAAALFLIPLLLTGGIHLDGFMDVQDALCSYGDREKNLEIMKDPHIGAFAAISLVGYTVAYLGACCMLRTGDAIGLAGVFICSRCFSGLSVVSFPAAKKDGTLTTFAKAANRRVVQTVLLLELAVVFVGLGLWSLRRACILLVVLLLSFVWYYVQAKRKFGGITGDVAGWFLCLCELVGIVTVGFTGWY